MLIIKGIIIGIGKIIPGVSGSMLAISMGIYQRLIDSINNLFKNPKENICFLSKVGIGALISIMFFSKIIIKSLSLSYIVTIFFFIGLIIGSTNEFKSNIDKRNNYIIFIILVLVLLLGILNINNEIIINNILLEFVFYIVVGVIDAITMIIPGISGTATLMMIGAYDSIISSISNLPNLSLFVENVKILFPFLIGMVLGIFLTARLIDFLFKNYKNKTYSAILGFSISTVILMGVKCFNTSYTLLELILAFILLIIGVFLSKKLIKN